MKVLGAVLFVCCTVGLCIAFPPLLFVIGILVGAWFWLFRGSSTHAPVQAVSDKGEAQPPLDKEGPAANPETALAYYERMYKENPEAAAGMFYEEAMRATGDQALAEKALEGWLLEQAAGGREAFQERRRRLQERNEARRAERERRERGES